MLQIAVHLILKDHLTIYTVRIGNRVGFFLFPLGIQRYHITRHIECIILGIGNSGTIRFGVPADELIAITFRYSICDINQSIELIRLHVRCVFPAICVIDHRILVSLVPCIDCDLILPTCFYVSQQQFFKAHLPVLGSIRNRAMERFSFILEFCYRFIAFFFSNFPVVIGLIDCSLLISDVLQ